MEPISTAAGAPRAKGTACPIFTSVRTVLPCKRGLFCEQRTARVANNTVVVKSSFLELPIAADE